MAVSHFSFGPRLPGKHNICLQCYGSPPAKAGVPIHPLLCASLWVFEQENNLERVSQQQEMKFVKLNTPERKQGLLWLFSPTAENGMFILVSASFCIGFVTAPQPAI